jgi:hypothetical protein
MVAEGSVNVVHQGTHREILERPSTHGQEIKHFWNALGDWMASCAFQHLRNHPRSARIGSSPAARSSRRDRGDKSCEAQQQSGDQ